jgi:hypothetical protein
LKSLKDAVDRGLALVAQIAELQDELAEIEAVLEKAALAGEQIELEDEERDGRQFLARGSRLVVPVVITADMLTKSFGADSHIHEKIAAVAGDKLRQFFRPQTTWKTLFDSGKIFRRKAREILGDDAAPAFITACVARDKNGIAKNAIKIEWKRAEKGGA